jgi:hypothetical protein
VDYEPPSPITFGASVAFIVTQPPMVKMVHDNNAYINLINWNEKNVNILKCSIRRL